MRIFLWCLASLLKRRLFECSCINTTSIFIPGDYFFIVFDFYITIIHTCINKIFVLSYYAHIWPPFRLNFSLFGANCDATFTRYYLYGTFDISLFFPRLSFVCSSRCFCVLFFSRDIQSDLAKSLHGQFRRRSYI